MMGALEGAIQTGADYQADYRIVQADGSLKWVTARGRVERDNTGRALFRYVGYFDLDLYQQKVVFFGDFNMFTDREASNVARPTELDWILGLAVRWRDYELSLYREQDRPLDRSGLIQEYWAVQLRYAFDVQKR